MSVKVVPQRPGSLSSGSPVVAQSFQLAGIHQGEQPRLEGGGELKGKPQIWMPRRERKQLGSDICLDAEATELVQMRATGVPISSGPPERLHDHTISSPTPGREG